MPELLISSYKFGCIMALLLYGPSLTEKILTAYSFSGFITEPNEE